MNKRRVVITGLGVVSPLGIGREEFWKNVVQGVSGADRAPILVNSDCPWKVAAEVKDFHPEKWLPPKELRRMDRLAHFGVVAAFEAVADAGLDLQKEDRERIGVSMGTAQAGMLYGAHEMAMYLQKGLHAVTPYLGVAVFTGSCGGLVSMYLGLKAPSITISTGCDCSTSAIAHAADSITHGDADIILAGGADAPIHPMVVISFGLIYAVTERNNEPKHAARPFDAKRDGFVIGEGGCVLVLEELEHARRRNAHIYAELVGWGATCDAHHMCHPDPSGKQGARALSLALARAGLRPDQVDYLNAHGTSTPLGDKAETIVVKSVFGENAYNVPISSIKSTLGHMQGACGAIEAAACCLSIRDNILPPTINYEYPDPECDLDYVPNVARHHRVDVAASNSFSFGGRNTAIVIKRYQDEHARPANSADGRSAPHENSTVTH